VDYADCQYGELLGRGPHQIKAGGFRDQSSGIKQSQREKCSEGAWTVLSILTTGVVRMLDSSQ
jgi:hypothetical protein